MFDGLVTKYIGESITNINSLGIFNKIQNNSKRLLGPEEVFFFIFTYIYICIDIYLNPSVADPDNFYTDPDPGPAFQFDTDPDPSHFSEVMYLKQYFL